MSKKKKKNNKIKDDKNIMKKMLPPWGRTPCITSKQSVFQRWKIDVHFLIFHITFLSNVIEDVIILNKSIFGGVSAIGAKRIQDIDWDDIGNLGKE